MRDCPTSIDSSAKDQIAWRGRTGHVLGHAATHRGPRPASTGGNHRTSEAAPDAAAPHAPEPP